MYAKIKADTDEGSVIHQDVITTAYMVTGDDSVVVSSEKQT